MGGLTFWCFGMDSVRKKEEAITTFDFVIDVTGRYSGTFEDALDAPRDVPT